LGNHVRCGGPARTKDARREAGESWARSLAKTVRAEQSRDWDHWREVEGGGLALLHLRRQRRRSASRRVREHVPVSECRQQEVDQLRPGQVQYGFVWRAALLRSTLVQTHHLAALR